MTQKDLFITSPSIADTNAYIADKPIGLSVFFYVKNKKTEEINLCPCKLPLVHIKMVLNFTWG